MSLSLITTRVEHGASARSTQENATQPCCCTQKLNLGHVGWKAQDDRKRMKRQQDIQRILEDFKGVKNIPGIKSAKKRVLITKMKSEKVEIITSRKWTANVFGEFYK